MKYAIVETGGKQYKAVEGGTLEVDRLPIEIGENLKLDQVLMLVDGESYTIGAPVVKDTPIWTTVVEHFRGEKVIIFNYSPKKRIRVKTGHRQNYTRLLVEQIGGSELVKKEAVKKEAKPKAEKPAKKEAPKAAPAKKPAKKAEPKKTASKAATVKKAPAKKPAAK